MSQSSLVEEKQTVSSSLFPDRVYRLKNAMNTY